MTLAELINSEPANAGRTDQEVLDWLRESVVIYRDVPWLELQLWLTEQDIDRATLQTAATSGATAANRTAAQHIIDVIDAGNDLAAADDRVRAVVQASSVSGAAKAALVALAAVTVPRWINQTEYNRDMDSASWLYHIARARS